MENNENQEELFIPKTKHKFLKILLAVFLVAAMAIGGYFLYQNKFSSPNKIVTNILEDTTKYIDKVFDEVDNQSGKYKLSGLVKIDGNLTNEMNGLMDLLKQVSLQFDGEVDLDKEIGILNLNTKFKNDKLLNIRSYYGNNDVYFFLEDLFDKYIKISSDTLSTSSDKLSKTEINANDIKIVIKSIINALQDEINKHEFVKEDATITIDEKNVNTYNNYLSLKDKEVNYFVEGIINNLLSNNEFINIYKKLTNNDAREDLKDFLKHMNMEEFEGTYKISFYTTKGPFKKELVRLAQEINQDGQTVTYNIDKVNENEIIINANEDGTEFSSRIKKNNSAFGINLRINDTGMIVSIDVDVNYERINELSKVDVSNFVKAEDLTEEDQIKIDENLGKNENIIKFIEEVQKLFSQNEV